MNAMNVRADHVVSSCSDAIYLSIYPFTFLSVPVGFLTSSVPHGSPSVTPRAAHLGRRLWVGRHRQGSSASATSCAAEHCTATERRCVVNAIHVRADHVG